MPQAMQHPTGITRVIVVVLDGLRADAVDVCDLYHLGRLMRLGASTVEAQTVSPSVTAAAMTLLLTGVHPVMHGMRSDRFHIPTPAGQLSPLPGILAAAGVPTFAFVRELPVVFRPLAWAITRKLGVERAVFSGRCAADILLAARNTLRSERRGLFVLHWPDADAAGHEFGWTSAEYAAAARGMDTALGLLAEMTEVVDDSSTLLIALADHGGGGAVETNHDSTHRHDRTIPIMLAGGRVTRTTLRAPANLVDVPATVLYALGVTAPRSYVGRPFAEAFAPAVGASAAYAAAS